MSTTCSMTISVSNFKLLYSKLSIEAFNKEHVYFRRENAMRYMPDILFYRTLIYSTLK